MHWREIEVGMWIDKVGLVTEVKESPVVAGEPMARICYVDPNDLDFVMCQLADDDDVYEEAFDRGTHEWASLLRDWIENQKVMQADAKDLEIKGEALLALWTDGPPAMPLILDETEGQS